jgi:pteridine reductase
MKKTVLITGGTKRFGKYLAREFHKKGWEVLYTYFQSTERLAFGRGFQCDLRIPKERHALLKELPAPIDALINNASFFQASYLENHESILAESLQLHVQAPAFLSTHLGAKMKARGWGRIINVLDTLTLHGKAYPNYSAYHCGKYALMGLTKSLALDLAPEVTVNAIAPGFFIPPDSMSSTRAQEIEKQFPLKVKPTEEEVCADVMHLIESNYKTGVILPCDSGVNLPLSYF